MPLEPETFAYHQEKYNKKTIHFSFSTLTKSQCIRQVTINNKIFINVKFINIIIGKLVENHTVYNILYDSSAIFQKKLNQARKYRL